MTIDEAIKKCKDITNKDANLHGYCMCLCNKCEQEHVQIAEWLEELKAYRENSNGYNKEDIELNRNAMYNKAIDDLMKKSEYLLCTSLIYEEMEDIAEQLKYSKFG